MIKKFIAAAFVLQLGFVSLNANTVKSVELTTAVAPALQQSISGEVLSWLIPNYVAPAFGLTADDALNKYNQGLITIEEIDANHIYEAEYDGILEVLIHDGQG